ncbi:tRNA (guanosine(46)-N7)-methyltransferase TrmB [Rickettsiales bacterium]|nr:tRNA (guanosine(46)-N7)-methyltransferase TrmB [Rickettsiales bacterium]
MKRIIRSFGRIKSRKLSDNKIKIHQELLPIYQKDFATQDNLILEIGFGFGDFTFELAKKNPNYNIIASETHINGVINLLSKLEKEPLNNISIFQDDVRILLGKIPDNILNKVYILFPDPWPKAKHHKRRIINNDFIKILSKKIQKNGKLIIATDHDSYKKWIMNVIISNNEFTWNAKSNKDWQEFPLDWTYTKYQKKAEKEGRKSIYLELINQNI